jgi:hypothetical protein
MDYVKIAMKIASGFEEEFTAGKYKETKSTKVDKLKKVIQSAGISASVAEEIADAMIRSNRDITQLAVQKNWPIDEDMVLTGQHGQIDLSELVA